MIFWKRQNWRYSKEMSCCQRLKEMDEEGWVRSSTGTICCCLVQTCLTLLQPMDCRPDFPGGSVIKNPFANAGNMGLIPRSGRFPGEGNGTPVFLPVKFHGQRSLAGYSLSGHNRVGHSGAIKHAHMDYSSLGSSVHGISQARTGVGCHSLLRDWTHVSCTGRWILCHWATSEAQGIFKTWYLDICFGNCYDG